MSNNVGSSPYAEFTGPNLGYVMEMYEVFKTNPEAVDAELAEMFRRFGAPDLGTTQQDAVVGEVTPGNFGKVLSAYKLLDAIRTYGHLAADIYPLNDRPKDSSRLELSYYGLTENDLREMPATLFFKQPPVSIDNGLDAVNHLKSLYTGKIAYEFAHIIDEEERNWIQAKIENGEIAVTLSAEEKKALLERLTRIEGFEKFIHRTFVGAKRFSIEGLDTLVVLLEEFVRRSEDENMKKC